MADPRVGDRMEVYPGQDGDWYVRHVAANNEPMSVSEGYSSKAGAKHAARRAQRPVFVRETDGWELDPAGPEPGPIKPINLQRLDETAMGDRPPLDG